MPAFVALKTHLPLLDRIERAYPAAFVGRSRTV